MFTPGSSSSSKPPDYSLPPSKTPLLSLTDIGSYAQKFLDDKKNFPTTIFIENLTPPHHSSKPDFAQLFHLQPGKPSTETELWYLWSLAVLHHYAISIYPLQLLHYFADDRHSTKFLWIFLTWFLTREQWNEICNEHLQQFQQPDIQTIFLVSRDYQHSRNGPVPYPMRVTWKSIHGRLSAPDKLQLFHDLCDWNARVMFTPGQVTAPKTTKLRYQD